MDGAHRLGILCVASKALPRSHVAASLLSLRSQLNCHPLETSDLQSKRASPSLTSSHFVFFNLFELERVDYFHSSVWVSLVHNLIDGLLCNL